MTGHTTLGEFLRQCRADTTPQSAGVPDRPGRRVQGLRREEVAHLAGMSVDYYTRLEQGRHTSPSTSVLDALATVFGLDAAARAHLADLARPARGRPVDSPPQRVRPAMQQLLASLSDHPALVLGRRTDVLASNALARALTTDWPRLPGPRRSYARWVLLDPAARAAYLDWETVAAEVVGTLRLYAGRHPEDARMHALVDELTAASPEFRSWWDAHQVYERTHGVKRMVHPEVGPVTVRYEALVLPGDDDQVLFVYHADPGSRSHDNLRLLGLVAAQRAADARAARTSRVDGSPHARP